MNCREFTDSLWSYFEGKLTDAQKTEGDEHAAGCDPCGALLAKARELTCRDFAEFLGDYVAGRLPPDRTEIFERHLSICPVCVAYLDGYRKTIALAQDRGRDDLEDVPPEMMRAILDSWSKSD